jgi:hypothetical protein
MATNAVADKARRRETSVVSFVEDSFTEVALSALCALVYEIAP